MLTARVMRSAIVGASLGLLLGCGGGRPNPAPDDVLIADRDATARSDAGLAAGQRTLTIPVGGVERRATLYVPEGLSTPSALVVALHGTGGSGEGLAMSSGWRALADAQRFIVVMPSALRHCFLEDTNFDARFDPRELSVTEKWSDGKLGSASQPLCTSAELAGLSAAQRAMIESEGLADDRAFLAAIVDDLRSTGAVDDGRVFLSGFSNGGNLAARLIVEDPTRFAAAHVAAGFLQVETRPSRSRPVLLSFGTLDGPSLARTGQLADPTDNLTALPFGPAVLSEPSTALRLSGWQSALGTPGAPTTTPASIRGVDTLRFVYAGPDGARFEALLIDRMGHVYGNGMSHPIDIAAVAWRFFNGS
jgi:poly(3-hydroxybutyrate) depolymerase